MSEDFEVWKARTQLACASRGINYRTADPLIDAAKEDWENSGKDPWEALGSPKDFADAVAAEQPVEARAGEDRNGQNTGDYLSGLIFALALMAVPWSLALAFGYRTMSVPLTPARLVAAVLFVVALFCLHALPQALRASGRPQFAIWAYIPTLIAMALTVGAAIVLPKNHLISVNVLILDAVALFVAWLTVRPTKEPEPAAEAHLGADPSDPEAWFARLKGVLIGRHDLPPARAAELVGEARAHFTGTSPTEEFGRLDVYATELAEPETVRYVPTWHTEWFRNLVLLAFNIVLTRDLWLRIFGS
jgi:hypothetical protein